MAVHIGKTLLYPCLTCTLAVEEGRRRQDIPVACVVVCLAQVVGVEHRGYGKRVGLLIELPAAHLVGSHCAVSGHYFYNRI